MRRFFALLVAVIVAAIGWAVGFAAAQQSSYAPPLDPSTFATAANLSALQAAMPAHCSTTPSPDSLLGSVASGNCFTAATDTRPTVVQAAIVSTDVTGAWSVTWAKAFVSASPYINPQAINVSGSQPYVCNVSASTTTTAAGKCWQTTTMTLPTLATSLLGLALNPTGASGVIQVRVAARDATQ